jgi:hypothetical protein
LVCQQQLSSFVDSLNLTKHTALVDRDVQFAVITALVIALFLILVHPDTLAMSAPLDGKSLRAFFSLLLVATLAITAAWVTFASAPLQLTSPPGLQASGPDRLAFICALLC